MRPKTSAEGRFIMGLIFLLIVLFIVYRVRLWWPVSWPKVKLYSSRCSIYYGAPGSGKTTYAAYLALRALKSGYYVFSNVPISGCYKIEKSDLGKYAINDCLLIWDEAGLDFNNRDYKANFNKASGGSDILKWFKYHRHEGVELVVLSQGFDDMDKKIRDLNTDMFIVRRGFLPKTIIRKRIRKRPDIDELTHSPIDKYYFVKFGTNRIFGPALWKSFDSFERIGLPQKDHWEKWQ